MLWLVRFAFSKEEDEEEEEHGQSVKMCLVVFHTCDIFMHAVTFSHVLHLDVLRRQIESEIVMYGYNTEPPIAIPIYTVLPYCVIQH